jgi:methionine sulfoxide reductase heme-binding subunit
VADSRPLAWLILSLPGLWMLVRWALTPDRYGYGHIIGDSGQWAAWLLMLTLAVTPIHLAFRRRRWAQWLVRRRRDIGVASFAYAAGHTAIYLIRKASADVVIAELGTPYILVGWLALALFVPLAVTSNDMAVRALKRAWKRLHRLVYPAAILTLLHWVLSAFEPTTAYVHAAILAAIVLARIVMQWRQRVT